MAYFWDSDNPKAYNNRVGRYKLANELDFILQNTSTRNDILDIAGGSGRCAVSLCNYFDKVTVLDNSVEAIEKLKARNPAIHTISVDFNVFQPSTLYSNIICIESLGYFFDLDSFFQKVASMLDVDGRFVFTVTNPKSWRYFLRYLNYWREKPTHYNNQDLKSVVNQLQKAGFEIVEIKGMNWIPLPYASNSRLVEVFIWVEKKMKLYNWHSQSPWLLVSAHRPA